MRPPAGEDRPRSRSGGRLRPRRNTAILAALCLSAAIAATGVPARAGELTLAWERVEEADLAFYRLHVGARPNAYDRQVDVPADVTTATLTGLPDEAPVYIRVEALARDGEWSLRLSPELEALPRARVTGIERLPKPVGPSPAGWRISGASLGSGPAGERLVRWEGMRGGPRRAVPDGAGGLLFEADEADPPAQELIAAIEVMPSGPRARAYFDSRPGRADLDGDGAVGPSDLARILGHVGSGRGEAGYDPACDLDGDGRIDGEDLALVVSLMAR